MSRVKALKSTSSASLADLNRNLSACFRVWVRLRVKLSLRTVTLVNVWNYSRASSHYFVVLIKCISQYILFVLHPLHLNPKVDRK